jgi:hypothetical protein
MPRYEIIDDTGTLVQALICPADQIAAFTPAGHSAVQTSPFDATDATTLRLLRRDRDRALAESDWVEAATGSLSVVDLMAWRVYRDRLRDITDTMDSPQDVALPDFEPVTGIDVDTLSRATWQSLITLERDRRIAERFFYQGQQFDFDPVSKARITGAATLAGFAMADGADPDTLTWHGGKAPFVWIAGDNSTVPMTAPICFGFGQAAAAHEAAHVFAARAIKDADVRPADWFDDRHWPEGDTYG